MLKKTKTSVQIQMRIKKNLTYSIILLPQRPALFYGLFYIPADSETGPKVKFTFFLFRSACLCFRKKNTETTQCCTAVSHFMTTSKLRPPQNKDHFLAVTKDYFKGRNCHKKDHSSQVRSLLRCPVGGIK